MKYLVTPATCTTGRSHLYCLTRSEAQIERIKLERLTGIEWRIVEIGDDCPDDILIV